MMSENKAPAECRACRSDIKLELHEAQKKIVDEHAERYVETRMCNEKMKEVNDVKKLLWGNILISTASTVGMIIALVTFLNK